MATTKLSETARAMLTLASTHRDRLVRPPQLPTAAARQVVRAMLRQDAVEEIAAPIEDAAYTWRTGEDGTVLMLRATEAGLAAIGQTAQAAEAPLTLETFAQMVIGFLAEEGCNVIILEEDDARTMVADGFSNGRLAVRVAGDILTWLGETEEAAAEAAEATDTGAPGTDLRDEGTAAGEVGPVADVPNAAPKPPTRVGRHHVLRRAAADVLEAWDASDNQQRGLPRAIERLRAALAKPATQRTVGNPRAPRTGTKQAEVLEMLSRPEGATVAQIAEATGWQTHTVRGFFAGLKKKGITVAAAERVRVVDPDNKPGSKGSFTIYRVTEAG